MSSVRPSSNQEQTKRPMVSTQCRQLGSFCDRSASLLGKSWRTIWRPSEHGGHFNTSSPFARTLATREPIASIGPDIRSRATPGAAASAKSIVMKGYRNVGANRHRLAHEPMRFYCFKESWLASCTGILVSR